LATTATSHGRKRSGSRRVCSLRQAIDRDFSPQLLHTIRGQYAAGSVDGTPVPGYRDEPGVDPESLRETFVAMKLDIDNWRWADVPFYIRSGKRLAKRVSEISNADGIAKIWRTRITGGKSGGCKNEK